jgi:hypothetical protein
MRLVDVDEPLPGIAAMSSFQIPGWQIVALWFMGKRELGQMTVFDLVVILHIANAVQNAMVEPDVSVAGGVLAAFVLLAVNRGISALRLRGEFWRRLLEGTPTVLIFRTRCVPRQRRVGAQPPPIIEAVYGNRWAMKNLTPPRRAPRASRGR